MKRLTLFFFTLLLSACVKDTITTQNNQMFSASVTGADIGKVNFIADGTTKYKIDLTALDGVKISDGKTATISVTDGSLSAINNLGSGAASSTISTILNNSAATFYYIAGSKAQANALLTITVEGISQSFNFAISPSEPDNILLSVSNNAPSVNDNVTVTAYLVKNNANGNAVSVGLKVFFTITKPIATDPISATVSVPGYASSQADANGLLNASTAITTNKKPGTITVTATYTKSNGSSVTASTNIIYAP